MSDLIFVDSQADQLESSLLASIEEPNPMLPDESRDRRRPRFMGSARGRMAGLFVHV